MPSDNGWSSLFSTAFRQSRNAMALVDGDRRHVDVNGAYLNLLGYKSDDLLGRPVREFIAGGPLVSDAEWAASLAARHFNGEAAMVCRDGSQVTVQWGATTEVVTGRRLVLFVALNVSRGRLRVRNDAPPSRELGSLTKREREVLHFVALGYTGLEIAAELQLAHETVRTHVRNAMGKTGARSRAHLVAKALGEGLTLG